eukprot:1541200-Pleurochrysis_carterae.AAC.1
MAGIAMRHTLCVTARPANRGVPKDPFSQQEPARRSLPTYTWAPGKSVPKPNPAPQTRDVASLFNVTWRPPPRPATSAPLDATCSLTQPQTEETLCDARRQAEIMRTDATLTLLTTATTLRQEKTTRKAKWMKSKTWATSQCADAGSTA